MIKTQFQCIQELKLRRAYIKGFRRKLDEERRRTMQQVYNKGQAPVASDRIATVVTRDRGRPWRPQNETPEEAI